MSEELDQVQPEEEVRPEEGQEAENEGGQPQEQQPNPDEDKARRMGWVPKEEFRGDPSKWVSAEEFNRRGEEQLPLLRANLRRTEQELAELRETTRKFAEFHKRVEQESYSRALETLRQEKIAARQEFDVAKEMEVDEKIAELKQKGPPKDEPAPQKEQQLDPDYVAWMEENPWAQDREAYAIGMAIGEKLRSQGDRTTGRAFLDKIKLQMVDKYPQLIPGMDNPNRRQPAAVGQSTTLPKKAKKTFSDLPSDAKEACRDFVKRGFITEEQYIKDYFQE